MREHQDLEHMELFPVEELQKPRNYSCYPLRPAVMKDNFITTKVHVVFEENSNGASGASLNVKLMFGPKYQGDILPLLTKDSVQNP
jgi:hypothetical protein